MKLSWKGNYNKRITTTESLQKRFMKNGSKNHVLKI